jgi:hypothetical protein
MPDHRHDMIVYQLLRRLSRRARIARVVLRLELQCDLVAADHQPLRVDLLHGEPRTIFKVFAGACAGAGQRRGKADKCSLLGEHLRCIHG